MTDSTPHGTSRPATPDEQEAYWQLSGEVARLTDAVESAQRDLRAFGDDHPGLIVKAFRPSDIQAAFREDTEPWDEL